MKEKSGFAADRTNFNIILGLCCSNADMAGVHQTLALMKASGFPPDNVSCDLIVRALCSSALEDEACELFKEIASSNLKSRSSSPLDMFTFNFLVRHLCKTRAMSTVYEFINEAHALGLEPDLVTYILIDAVCRSKNLREATRLLGGDCMLDRGAEALTVYKKMREEGCEPDLVSYNTLIYGLSNAGKEDIAKQYLRVIVEEGHLPDTVTYTSLMNGMCMKGDAIGALELLKEMEERGCEPNSCTYNTLLQGLFKAGNLDQGMEAACYAAIVRVFDYAVARKSLAEVAAYSALKSSLKWLKKSLNNVRILSSL
ncbi:hypothetical protein AMTRI_Chr09g15630 [Amborella trichopoda]